MYQTAQGFESEQTQQPQNEENDTNNQQYDHTASILYVADSSTRNITSNTGIIFPSSTWRPIQHARFLVLQ